MCGVGSGECVIYSATSYLESIKPSSYHSLHLLFFSLLHIHIQLTIDHPFSFCLLCLFVFFLGSKGMNYGRRGHIWHPIQIYRSPHHLLLIWSTSGAPLGYNLHMSIRYSIPINLSLDHLCLSLSLALFLCVPHKCHLHLFVFSSFSYAYAPGSTLQQIYTHPPLPHWIVISSSSSYDHHHHHQQPSLVHIKTIRRTTQGQKTSILPIPSIYFPAHEGTSHHWLRWERERVRKEHTFAENKIFFGNW